MDLLIGAVFLGSC